VINGLSINVLLSMAVPLHRDSCLPLSGNRTNTTRGLLILVARLSARYHNGFFHFAITLLEEKDASIRIHPPLTDRISQIAGDFPRIRYAMVMAGLLLLAISLMATAIPGLSFRRLGALRAYRLEPTPRVAPVLLEHAAVPTRKEALLWRNNRHLKQAAKEDRRK
jgi:hypothetical protein